MPFSIESLWEEVDIEINNKKRSKILADLSSLNLNRLDHVSLDVVLCAVAPSRWVSPLVVQHHVLKIRCPAVDEGDLVCLLQCVFKLPNFPLPDNNTAFHVFTPTWCCHLQLLSYNNSVRVAYHNLNGVSKGVKVSLTCNWCCIYYGYSKYGNPSSGWNLYDAIRITVEATVLCVCSGWNLNDEPTVAYLTYKLFCHLLFWSLSLVGVIQWFFWGLQQSSWLENRLVSHFFQKIWLQLRFYF